MVTLLQALNLPDHQLSAIGEIAAQDNSESQFFEKLDLIGVGEDIRRIWEKSKMSFTAFLAYLALAFVVILVTHVNVSDFNNQQDKGIERISPGEKTSITEPENVLVDFFTAKKKNVKAYSDVDSLTHKAIREHWKHIRNKGNK
ncbi:hypothetical protein [Sphingobacterium deserti]|uniref:Uncharacterized protein n=1 Tax=Sphingobacterium deserti TaxID=1229276 RepID=A0A0B8TCW8_9SPHI|nr:hypothetical protein [Sphingobacterium deserti]KGE16225.1 hypothetical protein DI53_0058 [Sphingobacterium deserti]